MKSRVKFGLVLLFLLTLLCAGALAEEPAHTPIPKPYPTATPVPLVVDGFTYNIRNGQAIISRYDGRAENVVIPRELSGYPVTLIGSNAFKGCVNLKSIALPDTLTTIGKAAFSGCVSLKTIDIPVSVTSIDPIAFEECYALTDISITGDNPVYKSIDGVVFSRDAKKLLIFPAGKGPQYTVPAGTTEIGIYAFRGSKGLVSLEIPRGVQRIEERAFSSCHNLQSVNIPDTVSHLGVGAFVYCPKLEEISLPKSIGVVNQTMFNLCSGLHTVILEEGITAINGGAFSGCNGLNKIVLPKSLSSIAVGAFSGCNFATASVTANSYAQSWCIENNMAYQIESGHYTYTVKDGGAVILAYTGTETELIVPAALDGYPVEQVDYPAFYGNTGLTSISFGKGLKVLGDNAFSGCENLKQIQLPDSLVSIGMEAFYGCKSLTYVRLPAEMNFIGECAFGDCTSLKKIHIPENVTSIGSSTFLNCSKLERITLPESVSEVGYWAFDGCSRLTKLAVLGMSGPEFAPEVFSKSPTVYCYEYSDTEFWAKDMGYRVVLLDEVQEMPISELCLPEDCRLETQQEYVLDYDTFPMWNHVALDWKSSNPNVATVSRDGVMTLHAAGQATITASYMGLSDSMKVTAYVAPKDFDLSHEGAWVVSKSKLQLSVVNVEPAQVDAVFTWKSSDTSIVEVNQSGLVTAKAIGDAIVSVTSENGLKRSCLVHVCYPVTAIQFESDTHELPASAFGQLQAHVTARTQNFTNKLVTFSSSDEGVALVTENGVVIAKGTGTATITARAASGVQAACTVQVRDADVLILPSGLKELGEASLEGNPAEVVILPQGCETIGASAFAGAENLRCIHMPDSVTGIAEDAFEGCESIAFLCASDNAAAAYAREYGIAFATLS